ncbi:MAG: DUF5690 family protein [Tannerella sp.]|jgi:hypothetical protein|nr:DUF5690 family protein [Tannerella sp.]
MTEQKVYSSTLDRLLGKNAFLIIWCIIAAFGTYFCTYAFRKPFNAGTYEGYVLFGIGYKTVLIISQMLGYLVSKYCGIKIIAGLNYGKRILYIIALVAVSELALVGFGLTPYPYNFVFLFMNGLPLGLIFGIIFSFLEGRRFTEMLSLGLTINMIMGSGALKSIYFIIRDALHISEFWMPAVEGLVFAGPFLFFVWMLSRIPPQSHSDIEQRTKREAMTGVDKRKLIAGFGIGLFAIVAINALLTMCRDFRDNFMVEVAREINLSDSMNIFSQIEFLIGIVVFICVGCLSFIRSNRYCFVVQHVMIFAGLAILLAGSLMYSVGNLNPQLWFILVGYGIFLPYITIQSVYFDRFIALFKPKANAGFLIYICDSAGYTCSMLILLYKEFFAVGISFSRVLHLMSIFVPVICLLFLITAGIFFRKKFRAAPDSIAGKQIRKVIVSNI